VILIFILVLVAAYGFDLLVKNFRKNEFLKILIFLILFFTALTYSITGIITILLFHIKIFGCTVSYIGNQIKS